MSLFYWSIYFPVYISCLCYLLTSQNGFGLIVWIFAAVVHHYLYYRRNLKISRTKGRGVLITGCDTGFGHQSALKCHEMDFTVFACCLDDQSDGGQKLKGLGKESGRLHVIKMDVTNQEQVEQALHFVQDHLPELGLWGLVNNAGLGEIGFIEWLSFENHQKMGSVNLYGLIRVTKTFLPLIRQSRGRIVNVSSILGRMVKPIVGAYCATKYGIEAFSDALRLEMKPFNVNVSIVEPGNYMSATGIANNRRSLIQRQWDQLSESVRRDYGEDSLERLLKGSEEAINQSRGDISTVVNAVIDALHHLHPKARYVEAPLLEKIKTYAYQVMPTYLSDYLV